MTRRAWALTGAVGIGALVAAFAAGAAGNSARGEQVYARCLACHALALDRVGPHHCGLFGRRAGSVPDFGYSLAMKRSRITWDGKSLDRFLAAPTTTIPGTSMTYDGVPDRQERADLIAYLQHVDQSPACRAAAASRR